MSVKRTSKHIKLTSHPGSGGTRPLPITWGAADPAVRGPVIATLTNADHRNVIGTHSGGEDNFGEPKQNVAAGGSALSSLIAWARSNW